MSQCLEGVRHLLASLQSCCDLELYKKSRGIEDPEILARETLFNMDIEIISQESIKPSSPTPPNLKTFELSLLDQLIISPYVPIILYYPNNNGDTIFQAIERSIALKKSLSKTLTQFYPLAGRVKDNLSIDCDDVGANFVLALVHRRLDEFLRNPDHGLINRFLPFEPSFDESSAGEARVTNVQMNIFECGGIVIGLCISHKILDGAALHTFLKGWSNMASGAKEVVYPNLTAPSLFPAKSSWLRDISMVISQSLLKQGKCVTKRFLFGSDAIAKLKTKAATNGVQNPTRVEAVSALIWKCAMAASKEACGLQNTSRLTHFVNLRKKLGPTLSKHSICNLIWIANAVCPDSHETTLDGLANKVRESISKIDVEFVNKAQGDEGYIAIMKSLQEMGQVASKGPIDNYSFTSWCNMGFYEIDFGWGKPSWVTGLVGDGVPVFMNLVSLMDAKSGDGGIEAWLNLDEIDMKILQGNQELLAYASLDPSPL
uniref:stemmadenine O-acetyltransferase-like n=1 Tax=Erigeron canadensis TaxID=72917 RepID=UPI001CB8946A|nr:stemmadenine O-acetyltransferase-like [Erigeron canadensis]